MLKVLLNNSIFNFKGCKEANFCIFLQALIYATSDPPWLLSRAYKAYMFCVVVSHQQQLIKYAWIRFKSRHDAGVITTSEKSA